MIGKKGDAGGNNGKGLPFEFDSSKKPEVNPLERATAPFKGGVLTEILCKLLPCDCLMNSIKHSKNRNDSIHRRGQNFVIS